VLWFDWSPGKPLELFIVFLKPLLNFVWCIRDNLTIVMKGYLVCNNVLGYSAEHWEHHSAFWCHQFPKWCTYAMLIVSMPEVHCYI